MDDGTKAGRELKHVVLDNTVAGINEIVDRLDSILNRLRGSEPELTVGKIEKTLPCSPPCFMEVLETSPDKIRNFCTEISEKLDEFENMLF